MTRGRPPGPIERKRLVGRTPTTDSGGRPLPVPSTEIVKTTDVPEPPAGLSERGSAEWVKIWTAGASWLAPNQDYPWVEIICRAWDDIEEFRARIDEMGLTVKGYAGQVMANPLIGEVRKAEAQIMKALSTLGFSPTDRARLGLAEIKRVSKLQEMMARGA